MIGTIQPMVRKIDINHKTVFFITAFIAALWALYQIRDVIILLFIAIIFMSAFSPIINFLERKKVPRSLAITVSYLIVIAALAGLISLVITPFFEQTANFFQALPQLFEQLLPENGPFNRNFVQDQIGNLSSNAINFSLAIFNNFIALISLLVITFYLLLERKRIDQLINQYFVGNEEKAKRITERVEDKLGAWLRGQVALSLIVGLLVYIVLMILQVPYALPLAIIAAILEVIPVIGPIISAIPAIFIAYFVSPLMSIFVLIAFFVIQQLENNIIVPQVMKRAVGLNPLIVILAVAIGGKLLGVAGALLAVPITVVIQVLVEEIIRVEKGEG